MQRRLSCIYELEFGNETLGLNPRCQHTKYLGAAISSNATFPIEFN